MRSHPVPPSFVFLSRPSSITYQLVGNRLERRFATGSGHSLICEYFILGFALWTIVSHITVLVGGSLVELMLSFTMASILLSTLAWNRIRKHRTGAAATRSSQDNSGLPPEQRTQRTLLWILVLVAAGITLVAHRPDADDSRYVNRAVAVADDPFSPILQYDTRHSIPEVPIRTTSKLISLEMLAGALSLVTGLSAISVFHLFFAPVAAVLTVLAYGQLFQILSPKYWAYGALAVMAFLLADGEVHRTFGNFSFLRLHQGKGILLSVIIPLIITYGLRFSSQRSARNWLLLGCSQIAAVGMNPAALMVGPVVAFLALLTGSFGIDRVTKLKVILLGLASSAYVVGLALYVKLPAARYYLHTPEQQMQPLRQALAEQTDVTWFGDSIELVFSSGLFGFVCLFIILTAWIWSENCLSRRLCLVFPFAVGLVFVNPLTADFAATYVTGKDYYWRVLWLLPLPAMAGVTLLAPLSSRYFRSVPVTWRYAAFFLTLAFLFGLASDQSILSERNCFGKDCVSIGRPTLKVPDEHQIAQAIHDATIGRPNVLVPEPVSTWLTTMHQHPYPLVSRFSYQFKLGKQREERLLLTAYIMGQQRPDNAVEILEAGIQHYSIALVCIPQSNPWIEEIRNTLRNLDFRKDQILLSHEIWTIPAQKR